MVPDILTTPSPSHKINVGFSEGGGISFVIRKLPANSFVINSQPGGSGGLGGS
ncbi:hypothetical protein DF16_orf05318 [Bacillus thuringiensis serovar kurstaki str. YBT-1520]|nr:hypothetical protein HD73_0948 [Bacillus thuringiensis serovar kurstaki str. HD73]AIM33733.1 hypothetical protein DF16_orf05318 [Bacillus thuringiensis serovar kurstaki str. YBT-1520]EEL57592.1 hypothetical protein bcere0023_8040 [Bacillus cereus Rock4-2]EEM54870.1 hypothetical protein bthur0006_7300 [Bacillus thuringiensis serovar kurstaki str. T03a001]